MLHAFLKSAIYQIFNPIYCVCAMGKQASFCSMVVFFSLSYLVDDGLFVRVQVQEKVLCGQLLYLCKYNTVFTEFEWGGGGMVTECSDCLYNNSVMFIYIYANKIDFLQIHLGIRFRFNTSSCLLGGFWLYLVSLVSLNTCEKVKG